MDYEKLQQRLKDYTDDAIRHLIEHRLENEVVWITNITMAFEQDKKKQFLFTVELNDNNGHIVSEFIKDMDSLSDILEESDHEWQREVTWTLDMEIRNKKVDVFIYINKPYIS